MATNHVTAIKLMLAMTMVMTIVLINLIEIITVKIVALEIKMVVMTSVGA